MLRSNHASALLLTGLLASGCMMNTSHIREEKREPTREEKIELYSTTATYLYDDGSLDRAQAQAVKVLELDPKNEAMRRMIGWIRLRMGKNEDLLIAEDFFRSLIRDGDRNEATRLGLATTVERLGSAYDAAADRMEKGEQVPGPEGGADVMREKARRYWDEALKLYSSTLTEGEGSTAAMNGMQRVYALEGKLEESLMWSERLLARSTEELDIWRRMLTQVNLTEKEEKLYRDNEVISQRLQTETHLFASSILHQLGRDAEAIAHLDAVIEANPDLPQAYSRRAQLLMSTGAFDRALSDLDRYLGLTDEPFEDPSIQRAIELRSECQAQLAQS
ncbi:MAG TPA: hypothetical protein ENJ09_02295 [Planctomycetes bacterium]|nr:hypothetical protein [Planctomycetota bacterium]